MLIRLVAAALTPLTFDEAYYWTWSKNLAGGFYDHPPMVAIVIRAGTLIAGDTELGVRLFSILLVLPMSWAVYRAAEILFASPLVASTAAILLNATMMVSVETMIVTPDSPLVVTSAFVLFFLAKVLETGRGAWWLAVGAAVGTALLSKYNALFFGPIILVWIVAVPELRRWLTSPWPYLGGLVALAMFSPVVLWNADHQWISFIKQFGRVLPKQFKPLYPATFILGQMLFATPAVFLLGASGVYALHKGLAGTRAAAVLIGAMVWTVGLYFGGHSLHSEVHPDYLSTAYPAFAVAAAVAVHLIKWSDRWQRLVDFLFRWAIPGSIAMFLLLMVQLNLGWLSGYQRDPIVKITAVGFRHVADEIASIRDRAGASCILVGDFGTTSWLMFYLPKGSCVAQHGQRIRWVNMSEPAPALLRGKLLFVSANIPPSRYLGKRFRQRPPDWQLERKRGPGVIESYELLLLEAQTGDVFDRSPAPEFVPPPTDLD
jgi:4-amino-4-deoxy-L-arabinose transferase-like glycosyltransferase